MPDTAAPKSPENKAGNKHHELFFLTSPADELFTSLGTSISGLSEREAERRLDAYGYNEPSKKGRRTIIGQVLSKFANPLVIVLLIIGAFSWFFGEKASAVLVFLMILISVSLSFIQEYRSGREAEKLSEIVHATSTVYRNGRPREVKIREIVPGDIVDLFAGDMIPADLRIISSKDLFINQASLTGESFPVEKFPGQIRPKSSSIQESTNIAFMGSSVVSGTALGLVIKTGMSTKFGELAHRLSTNPIETGFDRGIKEFTWLMIRFMFILVIIIFAINSIFKTNLIEALLFSLAVAVGLTPEMLPMLVTVNLAKGSIAMAKKQVIVKHLNSIQNLGAMDVLCTDKTGTLTIDQVVLEKHLDVKGRNNEDVLKYAYINSFYQTGLKNLLDKAILKHEHIKVDNCRKVDEMPFDFSRKIMSVVVETDGKHMLISKGTPESVFRICDRVELNGRVKKIRQQQIAGLQKEADKFRSQGFRVLAVAYKAIRKRKKTYSKEDENKLVLKGYLAFLDPPKPTVKRTIEGLRKLGIEIKILTGDNEVVTKKICGDVGLNVTGLITGDQIDCMSNRELQAAVEKANIFARLSPVQKERIILALNRNGHVVGFLGDGINDALALKSSDVGISVNNAVDIAKESADIILLRKSLTVLQDGVIEGRKTFVNLYKYIKMGASSNFGNMFSMIGASLFLPFLPMLPIQILLNNFLYDLSQISIPTDNIDEEHINKPTPWNIGYIKKFMMFFGPLSSIFDFITYAILLLIFNSSPSLFHTGWFLESLITQVLVIHIIRTSKIPFIESRPSKLLILTSVLILLAGITIPFLPMAKAIGFVHPPIGYFAVLFGIVAAYLFTVQVAKGWFIRKYGYE